MESKIPAVCACLFYWQSGGLVSLQGFDGPEFPIITGVDFVPITNGSVTQVMPLTELPAALPPASWNSDGIRPVFERGSDASLDLALLWPLEGRRWTEVIEPAPTQIGSLPAQNGRMNRGLSGALYRSKDNEGAFIERLDLATGDITKPVKIPGSSSLNIVYFAVSDDESRIVAVVNEIFDYNMLVYDATGELLARL